jgi:hypothetical protein
MTVVDNGVVHHAVYLFIHTWDFADANQIAYEFVSKLKERVEIKRIHMQYEPTFQPPLENVDEPLTICDMNQFACLLIITSNEDVESFVRHAHEVSESFGVTTLRGDVALGDILESDVDSDFVYPPVVSCLIS